MTGSRELELQRIFADAIAAAPDERAALLDRACADDAELRECVESLLAADQMSGDFLEPPAIGNVGERIGPYELREPIGEGGFAVVYRAEQHVPIRRDVALKIVKLGMDTKQVIARFTAERQALAILDHANIAKVFDAGATSSGRPYFVMELVRGVPITQYCDAHHLHPRERLELFIPICQAVQHAHQKGIVHRDIKPSNVLVEQKDGLAVPKIIDFGIAKAIGSQRAGQTAFTEFRQFIGTPAYMSPEQAGYGSLDIDTRSDIYSLGVLLYELLTGTTPIEEKSLRSAAYDQMHRVIREFDPPAPSTRIGALGDAAASIAALRHVEPKALGRTVRGEIDWIVMRCLEKDRARRYESAGALCDDLNRHLAGEAIDAGPSSAAYRFKKFAGRNRWAIALTSIVASSIVAALAVSLAALARERRERRLAEDANESSTAVANFAITRSLGDPRAEPLFRETYHRVVSAYGPDNPMSIVAERNFGMLLSGRGRYDEAELHLRDALERSQRIMGRSSRNTIFTLCELINVLTMNRKLEEAVPINRELDAAIHAPEVAADIRIGFAPWLGGMLTLTHRYAEARKPLLDALQILKASNGRPGEIRGVMQNLAEGYEATGDHEEARRWRRDIEAMTVPPTTNASATPP